MLKSFNCPLCLSPAAETYYQGKRRIYMRCHKCSLIFVPQEYHLSAEEEKAEYDLHQNNPEDMGYRRFLQKLLTPMLELLKPGNHGLDFGCGPGPTLSLMFSENGFPTAEYDHFYANDQQIFEKKYDFITATEVVEHLHFPGRDLNKIWNCIEPGGYLGIMTKLATKQEAFSRWHYIRDLTHVCFFSLATFKWLADLWGGRLSIIGNDVVIIQKKA